MSMTNFCCEGMEDAIGTRVVEFAYIGNPTQGKESRLYTFRKNKGRIRLNFCPWCGEKLWDYPTSVEGGRADGK